MNKKFVCTVLVFTLLASTMLLSGTHARVLASGTSLTGEVSIGATLTMTGGFATWGENHICTAQLAVEEVNEFLEESGANWTMKLVVEDTACDPIIALEKVESLAARGIELILGPLTSAEVLAIKEFCDANEILAISHASTVPDLAIPDDCIFRFCPQDKLGQGPAIGRTMYDDGKRYVIPVTRNDFWGVGLEEAVKLKFEGLGGTFLPGIRYSVPPGNFSVEAADLASKVTSAIATYGADQVAVLHLSFAEVNAFMTACLEYPVLDDVKWYGSDGTATNRAMLEDPAVRDFAMAVGYPCTMFAPIESAKYENVRQHCIDVLGREPDCYAYIAYDIVWVYALSLLEVGAYDSEAVKAVLPTVTQNYFGASGWIDLDENGDNTYGDYNIWAITEVAPGEYDWTVIGKYVARKPRIYADPLISYAGVGETFSINVSVARVASLYGFEFKLGYNTIFLDAVEVVIQPFLNEPTHVFREEINEEYNATFGFVWVAVTSEYPAEEVYGRGILATVTFQVMGLGGCALDLYDTKLSDPDGFPIDHSVEDGYYESGMTRVVSTESTADSRYPSLAVGPDGTIHIAWHDYTNYEDSGTDWDVFYKRYVPGTGWTKTEVVSTESSLGAFAGYPSLAVDSSGKVHVAWHDTSDYAGSETDYDIFYKYRTFNWSITEVVSTESNGTSWDPSLAVDSSGKVHVAWRDVTDYAGSETDYDIFYKARVAGNWTTTEVVSTESTEFSTDPSLAVDSSGKVHVAWRDVTDYAGSGTDYDIFYKYRTFNWSITEVVSTESDYYSYRPSLAVDSSGKVHVAWEDYTNYTGCGADMDIFYKYRTSSWSSTEVVSTESNEYSGYPSLAVDSSGKVHVAWQDYTNYTEAGTDSDIFYKRYEVGFGWTTTQVVSTESTGYSFYPSLAVDLARNIHVAWEDDTDYAGCGSDKDIFYKYLCVHSTQYPWSMFRHNLRHTGYTESPAPNTNQTLWNYTTGSAVFSSPAVADGMVFVGSNDSNVYALDQHTGAHIWNYTTGNDVQSSPTVADGMVFVGSDDGKVYALNQYTGAHIWNYTTGGSVFSSPAVTDGKVYVGSADGKIYCLDALTGTHMWNYTTGWSVNSSPAVADGKVYVGSHDGKVYCLDACTGAHIWNYTTGWLVGPSPAVAEGKVFVGSFDGKVHCLDASTGTHIWNITTGGAVSSSAVADGKVYVGSADGKIYCLDALTGAHIWNYTTGGWVESSPAIADGKVYVGSNDGKVYCLDASTKDFKWSYTTGSDVRSSPAVADGMLFVGSDDGKVYAFGNIVRVPEDFPDLQEAALHARPLATIIAGPGIYRKPVVIDKRLDFLGIMRSPGPPQAGGGSGIAVTILPGGSGSSWHGFVITNWDLGILILSSSDCKIYDNIMTLMDYDGIAVEGDNAANNIIYSNTFEENTIAINLNESSTSNTIYNNTISSNTIGLNLLESGENTIYANTIKENEVGIKTSNSNDNTIYWNSFINNDFQAISNPSLNTWDHDYPDGGNYWSNFKDHYPNVKDVHRGSNQDETGSDGIWDGPHEIDGNNIDRYPLVKPFSPHDIGITNVTTSKNIIGQGFTLRINLKILNYGTHNETFTATAYAHTTIMATQTITLTIRNSTTVTLTWNTTGVPCGNYTISANATIVPGETDTTDNTYLNGWVVVSVVGDVDGDGMVGSIDLGKLGSAYGSMPGQPNWNPEADLDGSGTVGSIDLGKLGANYGKYC